MNRYRMCISVPDLKLHKDFLPVIHKNRGILAGMSVMTLKILAFAREILDKYSGRFFYDFDFSAFVFLDRLMQERDGGSEKLREIAEAKTAAQIWNTFERQMYLISGPVIREMNERYVMMLEQQRIPANTISRETGTADAKKQTVSMTYIASPLFQKTVKHLNFENRILSARERISADFYRQNLVWEKMKEVMRPEEFYLGYSSVIRLLSDRRQEKKKENVQTVKILDRLAAIIQPEKSSGQSFREAAERHEVLDQTFAALETMIEEKETLYEIYRKVNIEFDKHNFTNFEDEKLCFLGVVKTLEKNEDGNNRFEDLIYRADSADENEWYRIWREFSEAGQSAERIKELENYLRTVQITDKTQTAEKTENAVRLQDPEKGEITTDRAFWETVRTMDERSLRIWIEEYRRLILRHDIVSGAVKNYESFIKAHKVTDFSERKTILLKRLAACRREYPKLFDKVPDRAAIGRILDSVPARLFAAAGKLPVLSAKTAEIETLSERVLKNTEHWEAKEWEMYFSYAGRNISSQNPDSEVLISRAEKVLELLKISIHLKNSADDLRKLPERVFPEFLKEKTGLKSDEAEEYIREIILAGRKDISTVFSRTDLWNTVKAHKIDRAIGKVNEEAVSAETSGNRQDYFRAMTVRELLVNLKKSAEAIEEISGEEQKYKVLTEKNIYKTTEAYMREIIEKDVAPAVLKEAADFEKSEDKAAQRLWRKWFFELHQWQERRIALAAAYETLTSEYEFDRAEYTSEILSEKELEKQKNGFLNEIQKYSERYGLVWNNEEMRRMRFFTLYTQRGNRLMELFSLERTELESVLPEIFSAHGKEMIRKFNQDQWHEMLGVLSGQYSDKKEMLLQRQKLEETFHILETARETAPDKAANGEKLTETGLFKGVSRERLRALPENIVRIFAETVKEYVRSHREIKRSWAEESFGETQIYRDTENIFSERYLRELENASPEARREFFDSFMRIYRETEKGGQIFESRQSADGQTEAKGTAVYSEPEITYREAVREIYKNFTEAMSRESAETLLKSEPGTKPTAPLSEKNIMEAAKKAPESTYRIFSETVKTYIQSRREKFGENKESTKSLENSRAGAISSYENPSFGETQTYRDTENIFSERYLRELESASPEARREFFDSFMRIYRETEKSGQIFESRQSAGVQAEEKGGEVYSEPEITYREAVREIYKNFTEAVSRESEKTLLKSEPGTEPLPPLSEKDILEAAKKAPESTYRIFSETVKTYIQSHREKFSENGGRIKFLENRNINAISSREDQKAGVISSHENPRAGAPSSYENPSLGETQIYRDTENIFSEQYLRELENASPEARREFFDSFMRIHREIEKNGQISESRQSTGNQTEAKGTEESKDTYREESRNVYRTEAGEVYKEKAAEVYSEPQITYWEAVREIYKNFTEAVRRESEKTLPRSEPGTGPTAPLSEKHILEAVKKAPESTYRIFSETVKTYIQSRREKFSENGGRIKFLENRNINAISSRENQKADVISSHENPRAGAISFYENPSFEETQIYRDTENIFSEQYLRELENASPEVRREFFDSFMRIHREIEKNGQISESRQSTGNQTEAKGTEESKDTYREESRNVYRTEAGEVYREKAAEVYSEPQITYREAVREIYKNFTEAVSRESEKTLLKSEPGTGPTAPLSEKHILEAAKKAPERVSESTYRIFSETVKAYIQSRDEAYRNPENIFSERHLTESEAERSKTTGRQIHDTAGDYKTSEIYAEVSGNYAEVSGSYTGVPQRNIGVSERSIGVPGRDTEVTGAYTGTPETYTEMSGSHAHTVSVPVTYRQVRNQEEMISRLTNMVEEQNERVERLLKEQKEMKSFVTLQREKADKKPGEENRAFERFMGQLQNELRMERLRRGF